MLFLPCGRAVEHASSLLRSPTAAKAFVRLRQQFDVVLVDAPPIMDRAEGAALASIADGIVIVLPPSTPSKTLDTLRRRIEVLGVPLIGVIVGAAGE
jgi:receptor protein-tyrosine kinase/non-specific protein-tyrosine kinase